MSRLIIAIGLVLGVAWPARAQLVVFDPANVARNTVTAILKEYLVNTQRLEREQIERMARRLSRLTDLGKYSLPEPPMWRIHNFWDEGISPLARDYHAALNYGDRTGRAILAVSHDVQPASASARAFGAVGCPRHRLRVWRRWRSLTRPSSLPATTRA